MTWKEMVLTAYHREGMILLSILWNADQMSGVGSVILGQGSHNVGPAGQRSKTEPESLTLFSQPLLVTVELLNDWSLEGHPSSHQRRPKPLKREQRT